MAFNRNWSTEIHAGKWVVAGENFRRLDSLIRSKTGKESDYKDNRWTFEFSQSFFNALNQRRGFPIENLRSVPCYVPVPGNDLISQLDFVILRLSFLHGECSNNNKASSLIHQLVDFFKHDVRNALIPPVAQALPVRSNIANEHASDVCRAKNGLFQPVSVVQAPSIRSDIADELNLVRKACKPGHQFN